MDICTYLCSYGCMCVHHILTSAAHNKTNTHNLCKHNDAQSVLKSLLSYVCVYVCTYICNHVMYVHNIVMYIHMCNMNKQVHRKLCTKLFCCFTYSNYHTPHTQLCMLSVSKH